MGASCEKRLLAATRLAIVTRWYRDKAINKALTHFNEVQQDYCITTLPDQPRDRNSNEKSKLTGPRTETGPVWHLVAAVLVSAAADLALDLGLDLGLVVLHRLLKLRAALALQDGGAAARAAHRVDGRLR